MKSQQIQVGLKTTALVLLIVGAIDSIRNLPTTALFGSSLIFFFVVAAIGFLVPTALVSAQLSSLHTDKSGIYHWVRMAFGEKWGFLSVWMQWINTMVWFPTVLSFVAGTATFFINPDLAQNKLFIVSVVLVIFWGLTWLNLKGLHTSAKFANACSVMGMVIPMLLIIAMAVVWVMIGQPMHIEFNQASLIPDLSHTGNWISLTAIMTSFLGMELATVHIKEVDQPQHTFPRALFISVLVIFSTMILGSLAIAIVLPRDEISLVNGVMQAFTNLFDAFHMGWFTPIITIMLLVGSLGNMVSWIISPAKGLLQAAQTGYLPEKLTHVNEHGVAQNLLITQAVLVSIICLAFLLMPSVNGSYWLLSDLSTEMYVMMYVLMFAAAIALKGRATERGHEFVIPGGKLGTWLVCLLGILGCVTTLVVGFITPENINVGTSFHYHLMFTGGLLAMLLPVLLFYAYKKGH